MHQSTEPWSYRRKSSAQVDPNTSKFDSKGFTAFIDVHSFHRDEISVATADHEIIVECKHNSKGNEHEVEDFVRKFNLPEEYDMSTVKWTICQDGILRIEAHNPNAQEEDEHIESPQHAEKPSLLMSLLSNRANSMLRRSSHSTPTSDNEEDFCEPV